MSTLGTLQHHDRFIEGSLLTKHAEKYVININKFRSTSIVLALLCICTLQTSPPFSGVMTKVSPSSRVSPEPAICFRRQMEKFLGVQR